VWRDRYRSMIGVGAIANSCLGADFLDLLIIQYL
jgi:hypothetical protein